MVAVECPPGSRMLWVGQSYMCFSENPNPVFFVRFGPNHFVLKKDAWTLGFLEKFLVSYGRELKRKFKVGLDYVKGKPAQKAKKSILKFVEKSFDYKKLQNVLKSENWVDSQKKFTKSS
jgi:hypothetical protein